MNFTNEPGRATRGRSRHGLIFALTLTLLAGCVHPPAHDAARRGPFHTPVNYAGESQLPANIRRVVLLPISADNVAPTESAAALDPVFLAELQKQNRFEIVAVTREQLQRRFNAPEIRSTAALPHDFMARLRREFAADAVLFVDLTVFKAYRPLALGVRAKLATVDDEVRLLWTFDNVFSATDPAVANSARNHAIGADRGGIPADLTSIALLSPTRFGAYVAAQTFGTLPPVFSPPPPQKEERGKAAKRR